MVLAAVLASLRPTLYQRVGVTARTRWGASLLTGFIVLVATPVAALLLLITLVGAPLALAGIALYLAILIAGYASAGIAVGQFALARLAPARTAPTGWRVGFAALGMLALCMLGRVPVLGALLVLAALLIGIGALVLQFGAPTDPSRAPGAETGAADHNATP